ncbi:hypothetical protein D3C87_1986720 [compost metagenome]
MGKGLHRIAGCSRYEIVIRGLINFVRKAHKLVCIGGIVDARIPHQVFRLNRNKIDKYFKPLVLHHPHIRTGGGIQVRRAGYLKII